MSKTVKPTTDVDGTVTLDMRVSPALHKDLYDEIINSIKRQQAFILTTLPSILIVTQKQFASLNNYTEEMYHTSDRMMNVGYCVMEIVIDREVDTQEDIELTMEQTQQLKEDGHDSTPQL